MYNNSDQDQDDPVLNKEDEDKNDLEMKRMWKLYQAEKGMGLLRPQEEIDQDIRDAGRGHLLGVWE